MRISAVLIQIDFYFYNNSIFLTVQPEKRKENKKKQLIDSIWWRSILAQMASFLSPTAQLRSGGPLQSGHTVFFLDGLSARHLQGLRFILKSCRAGSPGLHQGRVHRVRRTRKMERICSNRAFLFCGAVGKVFLALQMRQPSGFHCRGGTLKKSLFFPWRCSERMKEPLQRQYLAEIGASLTCDSSNNNVHQCSGNAVL